MNVIEGRLIGAKWRQGQKQFPIQVYENMCSLQFDIRLCHRAPALHVSCKGRSRRVSLLFNQC